MAKTASSRINRAIEMLEEGKQAGGFSDEVRRRLMMLIGHPQSVRFHIRNVVDDNVRKTNILDAQELSRFCGIINDRLAKKPDHYERPFCINPDEVEKSINVRPDLAWSLSKMEETGGKPDIIYFDNRIFIFGDCSAESPEMRRDLNFFQVCAMAKEMGVSMMTFEIYRDLLQKLGCFDLNSKSWLAKTESGRGADLAQVGTTSVSSIGIWSALLNTLDGDVGEEGRGESVLVGTGDDESVRIENYDIRSHSPIIGWRGTLAVPRVQL